MATLTESTRTLLSNYLAGREDRLDRKRSQREDLFSELRQLNLEIESLGQEIAGLLTDLSLDDHDAGESSFGNPPLQELEKGLLRPRD